MSASGDGKRGPVEGSARSFSMSLVIFLAGWSLIPAAVGRVVVVLFGCSSSLCCAGGSAVVVLLLVGCVGRPFFVAPPDGSFGCWVIEFWLSRCLDLDRDLLLCLWSWLAEVVMSPILSVAMGACGVSAFCSLSRKLYGLCVIFCLSSGWCVLRSGNTVLVCLNVR